MILNPKAELAWKALLKQSTKGMSMEDFFDIYHAIKSCHDWEDLQAYLVASPSSEGRSS